MLIGAQITMLIWGLVIAEPAAVAAAAVAHSAPPPQRAQLHVEARRPVRNISQHLWGIFFEDLEAAVDGGMYAELVKNRAFIMFDHILMSSVVFLYPTGNLNSAIANRRYVTRSAPKRLSRHGA